ncbi:unnamed protein product [Eruca vesicaria subsp. sativa]|uniref:Uncharacterized protein n=1 Tax=Eruca vesicaria subsp. sativa TaxID=29727 RepID=A0ABC8LPU0_ERUVS|nr:unnamed protein product [Eruca vesicaria subsp. sativa]
MAEDDESKKEKEGEKEEKSQKEKEEPKKEKEGEKAKMEEEVHPHSRSRCNDYQGQENSEVMLRVEEKMNNTSFAQKAKLERQAKKAEIDHGWASVRCQGPLKEWRTALYAPS